MPGVTERRTIPFIPSVGHVDVLRGIESGNVEDLRAAPCVGQSAFTTATRRLARLPVTCTSLYPTNRNDKKWRGACAESRTYVSTNSQIVVFRTPFYVSHRPLPCTRSKKLVRIAKLQNEPGHHTGDRASKKRPSMHLCKRMHQRRIHYA